MPFKKVFRRPGLRRILLPFTAGLLLLGLAVLTLIA